MSGSVVKNHTLLEITEQSNATRKTTYRSLSGDYQPVLPVRLQVPLLHRYRDSTEGSSSSPTTVRRRSTSSPVLGDQLIDSEQFAGDSTDTDPVQGNLLRDLPEWLEDSTEKLVNEGLSASRDTPASTSRESDSEHPRKVVSGKTVFILTSRKTEIVRSARGQKSQGPRAEDVLAEPYLVQKILVT